MRINDQVVETRTFPSDHLLIAGYLKGLKIDMLEQNDDLIKGTHATPVFDLVIERKRITRH